jgi:signal peptidase I
MMSRFGSRSAKLARESLHLGLLIVGILAARSTLADHYYVPSGSMENTLFAGDRVVVDKRAYGYRIPFTNIDVIQTNPVRRGDVVVFDSPKDGVRLIKRIVAVGGDRVRIEQGRVSINGQWLATDATGHREVFDGKVVELNLRDGGGPPLDMTVGIDQVLAIGDHRGRSADGRYFGTVPEREIYGRAVAIYYRRGNGFGWRSL